MPYDPGDAETFRSILNKLAKEESLSSEKLIDIVHAGRSGKKNLPPLDLTRYALDRFRQGKHIKNIVGLRQLWSALEGHSDYAYRFPQAPVVQTQDVSWPTAFGQFLSTEKHQTAYEIGNLVETLPGRYRMYRLGWRPRNLDGLARISLFEIENEGREFVVAETQSFPPNVDGRPHTQHDTGALTPFGKYIYFLMKEDPPGTTVKFGLITNLFPYSKNSSVEWFCGIIFPSSNLNIFPLGKFFCRRIDGEECPSSLVDVGEIPDEDARAYLSTPLALPSNG